MDQAIYMTYIDSAQLSVRFTMQSLKFTAAQERIITNFISILMNSRETSC